jgi:hypothetical protein
MQSDFQIKEVFYTFLNENRRSLYICLFDHQSSRRSMKSTIESFASESNSRMEFWIKFIKDQGFEKMAELGVYRVDYAMKILKECEQLKEYYLVDPWRNLTDWNKPFNKENDEFEAYYQETLQKTEFAADRRIVLRGKTTEVVKDIQDGSLDFAYIDGDHTLKGISIDLINMWDKVKSDGYIGGDDFINNIWQHDQRFEPTMIFPFAVYFAEARQTTIYGLPHKQFLISKECTGFKFHDLTDGIYSNTELRHQFVIMKKGLRSIFK